MKRKLLSVLLMLCLAFSLLPTAALAEGEGAPAPAEVPAAAGLVLPEAADGVITLENGTYVMSEDTTATIKFTNGKNATLDLNGKTFTKKTGEHTIIAENGATLTITGNGIVDNVSHGKAAVYNEGTVTLAGGTFKRSQDAGTASPNNANGNSWYTVKNFGTMVINSGVTIENKGSFSSAIANGWYDVTKAGNGSEPAHSADAVLTINGGNISGGKITVKNDDGGKLTINDGTFTQSESNLFCIYNANVAKITGGTINGCVGSIESNPSSEYNKGEFTISGGTFNTDVSEFVADGYILNNGTVEKLGETNAVAKVGDTYYKTLAAAVTAAKDGNTVKILRDVNTAERHDVVGKKLILDLNGQTITTTIAEQFMNIRGGGKLTVTDNSASKDGKIISPTGDYIFVVFKGELDFQAGTVDARGYWQYDNNGTTEYYGNTIVLVYGDTNDTENYATVTLGENANLIATTKAVDEMPVGEAYAIMVDKNKAESAYGVKVDIKGTTEHAGLYVNGVVKKTEGNVPVFNIYDGAVVDGQIYSAGYAKWNIYGGKITGSTGMEIRAGELNMTGGSLTGTATPTTVTPNGNGGTSDGAGLAIAQHTTKLPVIVNISDGTISGYSALYESNPQNNDSNSIAKVQIAVTGGNFAAINGGTNAVYSQDKTGFITGGYFTSKPAKEYIATGYYVVESDKDGYSCMISNTVPTKAQVIVNDTTAVTPPTNAHLTEADKTAIRTKTNVDGVAEAAAGSKNRIVKDAGVNASAVDASKLIEVEVAVDVAVSDVQKNAEGTAISTITFTAKPTATVKVDGNATGTPVPVENSMLNGQAITVKLPLPEGFTPEQIKHISSDRSVEYFLRTAKSGAKTFEIKDGCAVFTITKFSTFELSGTVTYVEPSYSSGGSSDPTYSVSTPSKTEHGTVTVSPKSASKGDRVTVTVKPDSGYVLETLTVTDKNGNELTLKDKGNGKYTFTMPAGKVEVKATFMEDNSMLNFFYDVPNNAYFYEAVKWAVKNGITDGVGDNLFAPEQPCTRAQIVTFLWRAAGSPEPKGAASGMTDVVSGSYYEKAVAWAIENGITTGTTTTTFSPDATCTRAQAVTFLARALKAKAARAAEFSDVPTGSYFADAVAWAAANGVTEGIGGGLFGSDNDCTRGQIVTFLYRAYNK